MSKYTFEFNHLNDSTFHDVYIVDKSTGKRIGSVTVRDWGVIEVILGNKGMKTDFELQFSDEEYPIELALHHEGGNGRDVKINL